MTTVQRPTAAFVGASWVALCIGAIAFLVGLWHAALQPSEKGFYAMSFVLSLFAVVAVQKNVRDLGKGAGMVPAEQVDASVGLD